MAAPRPPADPYRPPLAPLAPAVPLAVLLAVLLCPLAGARTAAAASFGEPAPAVELHRFQHGVDLEYTQRQVKSTRWNPRVTMRTSRIVARETYGVFAWRDVLVNVSGIFGVARSTIDFGAVNLGDAFWDDYAPDLVRNPPDSAIAPLRFGETFGSSFGASARIRLFRIGDLPVAGGGQLIYSQCADTGEPSMRLRTNDWDFWLGTQVTQPHLSFYAGLDASILIGEVSLPNQASDLDQADLLGVFGGLKMLFYRHLRFTTELRLINQTAVTGQMIYAF
jgi:hypothetical protein